MKVPRRSRLLQVACVLALIGLALIVWSLFDPRPVPVMVAMSVAQGIGTLSFLLYLFVVVMDIRRAHRVQAEHDALHPRSSAPPPPAA